MVGSALPRRAARTWGRKQLLTYSRHDALVRPRRCIAAALLALVAAAVAAGASSKPAAATVKIALLQGEQLVYVDRPGTTVNDAVAALFRGPTKAEAARQITTLVPRGTPLRSVSVQGRVVTVDVGDRFASGTVAEDLTARVAQLVLTATQFSNVRSVRLLVKGGTPLGLFPGIVAEYPISARDVQSPDEPPPTTPEPEPTKGESEGTRALQERLADLGFLREDAVDGRPGPQTSSAVVAFQKWAGLARDGVAGPVTRARLAEADRPSPIGSGSGRRAEVLLDRQVTLVIDGDRVTRVLDVSTGKPGFETPVGSWRVERKEVRSWSVPYKVWLPWASYFVGGVAFHEYPDVPPFPASHGCVRVPRWDAKWLYDQLPNGTPVTVIGQS
jgi:hypothetical protein